MARRTLLACMWSVACTTLSVLMPLCSTALAAEPITVFAAGSRRAVLGDIASEFTRDTGTDYMLPSDLQVS